MEAQYVSRAMDSEEKSSTHSVHENTNGERRRIVADLLSEKFGDKAVTLLRACRSIRLIIWTMLMGISGIMLVPMKKDLFAPWFTWLSFSFSMILMIPMNIMFTLTIELKVLYLILRQFGTWAYFGYVLIASAVFYEIHSLHENNGVLGYWWFLIGGNSIYFILLMIVIDAQKVYSRCDKAILLSVVVIYCGVEYFMLHHGKTYASLDVPILGVDLLDLTLAVCLHIGIYCLGCLWRLLMKPTKFCGVLLSPNISDW